MSYTPITWTDKSTLMEADHMNQMEQALKDHDDAIDKLNTSLVENLSVTVLERSGTLTLRKVGKICCCRFNLVIGTGASTTSSNTIDTTIPEEYRPAESVNISAIGVNSSIIYGTVRYTISTNGTITFNTDISDRAVEAYASTAWVCAS